MRIVELQTVLEVLEGVAAAMELLASVSCLTALDGDAPLLRLPNNNNSDRSASKCRRAEPRKYDPATRRKQGSKL